MKILLLEDDLILNEIIEEYLLSLNYEVISTFDGTSAEELIYDNLFDLLLFDVNVPNINGFKLLKQLKTNNINIPTIFITSLNGIDDIKLGFNIGCDDYLKKPFELEELRLRIDNIKKLKKIAHYDFEKISKNISYNYSTKIVLFENDNSHQLSKTESKVFEYLLKNKNRIISIDEILVNNWIYDEMPTDTTIRTYIKNLRKALGSSMILNIKGIGYKLII